MSYTTKVYRDQGGDRLVVEAGGIVQLKTGGQIVGDAGTQVSAIADLAGTVGADRLSALSHLAELALKNDTSSAAWEQLALVLDACPGAADDVEQLARQLDPLKV